MTVYVFFALFEVWMTCVIVQKKYNDILNLKKGLAKIGVLVFILAFCKEVKKIAISFYNGVIWYESGNLNECWPFPNMLGSSPAFGTMFHDSDSVTFLWPLRTGREGGGECKRMNKSISGQFWVLTTKRTYFKPLPSSQK